MTRPVLLGLVLGTLFAGCAEPVFRCRTSDGCREGDAAGVCLSGGGARYCAFPDQACSGGLRWHETAEPSLRGA
jgi:hypothetical protein